MRHLVDPHGREWHVYERGSSGESPLPARTSLVFDAEGIVRRLWQFPSGWAELPDDALLELMDAPGGARGSSAG